MKNVLIIGSTGMLGSTVNEYFNHKQYNVQTLDRINLDLSKCSYKDLFNKIIDCGHIDVVINCAALIRQRKDVPDEDFIMLNSVIPHWLVSITKKLGIEMIHVTTDCVYNGVTGGYDEYSQHHYEDADIYGLTKSIGDVTGCTTIRTSIIGEEKRNKISLLEWVRSHKKGERISGYVDHFWNGVTSLQLAKVMEQIISKNSYWTGIRHIYSPHSTSKYELVSMINEIYELGLDVEEISTDNPTNRTLKTIVDKEPTEVFNIPHLYKQIMETREFHHKQYKKLVQA